MRESIFLSEWLAANRPNNQLPISAVCNSQCIFCSNHLNPFPLHEGIFREVEDIKHQLTLMEQRNQPLRLGDSLPGRISEGEAFLHPRFFDILELIRRRFLKNLLCFTTNASMADDAFLKRLARFRPVEITVSMHSTQPALWSRIFARGARAATTAIASPALIRRYGMDLVGAIVTLPAVCGWADIERTFDHLVEQGAREMILFYPGYSARTPPDIVRDLQCPMEEYEEFVGRMKARHTIPITVGNDMHAPLDVAVGKIIGRTCQGNIKTVGGPYRRVVWLVSEAAHARLGALVAEQAGRAANLHHVWPVPNRTYGGNITVAGLLMTDDFLHAGRQALEQYPDTELFLVPAAPFDSLHRDLRGAPAHRIADELNKPVWLMDDAGGYEPLLSVLFAQPGADATPSLEQTMERFNTLRRAPGDAGAEPLLDMIACWPLETGLGPLSREQFLAQIADENTRPATHVKPTRQQFERLGDQRALCIEHWKTRDPEVTLDTWTFLVKDRHHWRIERRLHGSADRAGADSRRANRTTGEIDA